MPFVRPESDEHDRSAADADGPPSRRRRPWADYLAAAQRLDAVRRAASSPPASRRATVQAAQQELAAVRARLAPQRARLVQDLGVPETDLAPQPAERALAAQAVAGGPAAVLAALRQARGTADAADAAMLGGPGRGRHVAAVGAQPAGLRAVRARRC